MNYTKGKWEVYTGHDNKLGETLILAPNPMTNMPNFVIAKVCDVWPNYTETKANANLISASPDMYEALKEVLISINAEFPNQGMNYAKHTIKQALAKAEGKEIK